MISCFCKSENAVKLISFFVNVTNLPNADVNTLVTVKTHGLLSYNCFPRTFFAICIASKSLPKHQLQAAQLDLNPIVTCLWHAFTNNYKTMLRKKLKYLAFFLHEVKSSTSTQQQINRNYHFDLPQYPKKLFSYLKNWKRAAFLTGAFLPKLQKEKASKPCFVNLPQI